MVLSGRVNGHRDLTRMTSLRPHLLAPPAAWPHGRQAFPDVVSCWSAGCVAVGGTNNAGGSFLGSVYAASAFAEFWNGSRWALLGAVGDGDPPNAGAAWSAVQCQSAISCTAVEAWADGSVNETPSTLVSTWNGTAWAQQPSPKSGDQHECPEWDRVHRRRFGMHGGRMGLP
jgi:hypothetical protein